MTRISVMYLRSTGTAVGASASSISNLRECRPRLSVTSPAARAFRTQPAGPVARDQPALLTNLDDVDRCRVEPPGLAAAHHEDVPVRGSHAESGHRFEERVDKPRSAAQPVGLRHPMQIR